MFPYYPVLGPSTRQYTPASTLQYTRTEQYTEYEEGAGAAIFCSGASMVLWLGNVVGCEKPYQKNSPHDHFEKPGKSFVKVSILPTYPIASITI